MAAFLVFLLGVKAGTVKAIPLLSGQPHPLRLEEEYDMLYATSKQASVNIGFLAKKEETDEALLTYESAFQTI